MTKLSTDLLMIDEIFYARNAAARCDLVAFAYEDLLMKTIEPPKPRSSTRSSHRRRQLTRDVLGNPRVEYPRYILREKMCVLVVPDG